MSTKSIACNATPTSEQDAVYMERLDDKRNMARFYRVLVLPTLFGQWSVVCQWGRIGTHGQSQEQWLDTRTQACVARDAKLASKVKRGYKPRHVQAMAR